MNQALVYIYAPHASNIQAKHESLAGWQVDSAGFTLAPLQPQFRSGASNIPQSCLVTFVLKADLGGFLSEKSLAASVLPWQRQMVNSFLHSMLTAIMALRDTVRPSLAFQCTLLRQIDGTKLCNKI